MEVSQEPIFDAPIPGMALTHELGDRPWQTPAQLTNVDEAIDYYMERMSSEEFMVQLVETLESGVPVTVLANTIQMGSVMDGKHSLDVGMLVLPMLMEMMMLLGDSAGIKYDTGMEDPNKGTIRDSLFSKMLKEYEDDLKKKDVKAAVKEVKESDEEEKPKGLMARRK
jgi:hypothetical protein